MNKNKSIKDNNVKDSQPSATEDCADVTSKYDKYIKDSNKPKVSSNRIRKAASSLTCIIPKKVLYLNT